MANNTRKYVSLSKLQTFLENLTNKFASLTHTHKLSDITDYKVDSELSSTSNNPVQNKVLNEEFEAISEAMTIMEDAVDSKLNASDYKIDNGFSITSINPISNYAITARFEDLNREMPRDYVFVVDGDGVVDADLIKAQNTIDNGGFIYCSYDGLMLPLVAFDENVAVFTITVTEERMVSAFTVVIDLNTLEAECSITPVTADMVDASPLGHGHSASEIGAVPTSRTINGKELSSDIRLSASDVGALPSTTAIPSIEGLATETYVDTVASTKVDKVSGKGLSTNDYTTTEKNKLSGIATGAEVNQNAFSNVVVGSTTIAADSKTDSLTISSGTGISVTGDATNDKVTITNSGVRSIATGTSNGTISVNTNGTSANVAVKGLGSAAYTASTAYDAAGSADEALDSAKEYTDSVAAGKANASHTHDDRYYTETEIDTKLASKANSTHNHDSVYDAKGSASAVQENLDTVSDTLDTHTENADIHVTTTNKSNWNSAYTHSTSAHARTDATKVADSTTNGNILINGAETNVYSHPNSGVTAGTYKSVTVNAQGHITAGTNPTTLAGYGITDAESKGAANNALTSAKEYTDSVAAGKAEKTHNHDSVYDIKGAASSALTSAKTYADSVATTAANAVKNDLLNGAGEAYDTLKELSDLITDNQDAIDALETVAAGKADKSHTHTIANVSGLQSALDGKAASSHGTHVSYSTTAPVMDGTASVGTASTVARSDHKHPTDTSRAAKSDLDSHTSNTTAHITSTERSNWNAAKTHADSAHAPSNAEKNQNAFSNITVGSTTVAADTATDTVTFVGSNVTITPDATNDKITFAVADGSTSTKGIVKLTNSTSSTSTTTAATPSSVKSAYDLANTAKTNAATAQTKADSAYTLAESKVDSLSDLGITATATELNYVDGVTSNIQTQIDGKAASSHTHNYAGSSSAGGAATSANKVNKSLTVKLNGGTTEGTNLFTFNGSAAKSINITPSAIGAAASSHTHDDRYYTETEIDTKLSGKANKSQGIFYIEGSGTTDTTNKVATWTGSHSDISEYYAGLMIAYKIGTAGSTTTTLNINNLGAVSVVKNATSAINTSFAVNSVILLVYTVDGETAYWKAHDYDANTRNTVGDYRKNGTKLYFVGTTSSDASTSSSYATSYTNSNIYVDTNNVLCSASGFSGKLVGNADTATSATTATKATQDASGNVITSTYATKSELNTAKSSLQTSIDGKVTAVSGKGLSTNDFTADYKSKLDGITASADSVSFTQKLTSGTEVGTITINGTGTKLYAPTNTDTKNTAGSTNSSAKLFLIGAASQGANPQTYSHDTAYVGTDGCLYSNSTKVSVEGHTHTIANITNLQSSLDAKQATITGGATTITSSNLTASRALVSDSSGKVAVSAVTSTELGYLDGVTSSIQTQINGKAPTSHASSATTYGIGTGSNYGHVKLSDSTSSTSAASAGIAASPAAVKAAYDTADARVKKAGDTMTGSLIINKANPYVEFLDTGYSTVWYVQAYLDQFGFGPSWTNAIKSDKTGNMTVPGTVKVGNAVTLKYDSTKKCLNFSFT